MVDHLDLGVCISLALTEQVSLAFGRRVDQLVDLLLIVVERLGHDVRIADKIRALDLQAIGAALVAQELDDCMLLALVVVV